MAKLTSVNQTPATGAAAMYSFKQCLVSAGWTVKASSDGTTYNSTGDQITDGTKLAAAGAWFRIQDPGTNREFVFQRGSTNLVWRVKYSRTSKFTGGTPGVTQVPSAADEAVMLGAGTDGAPTYASMFSADGNYRCHTIAFSDAIASGGASPSVYSFILFCTTNGTGAATTKFICDGMVDAHPLDADSCAILLTDVARNVAAYTTAPLATWIWGWCRYGLSGAAFTNWCTLAFCSDHVTSSRQLPPSSAAYDCGPNPHDNSIDTVKIVGSFRPQAISSTLYGYKGTWSRIAFNSSWGTLYPTTHSLSTDAHVWVDDVLVVPWEDNTAPAV